MNWWSDHRAATSINAGAAEQQRLEGEDGITQSGLDCRGLSIEKKPNLIHIALERGLGCDINNS